MKILKRVNSKILVLLTALLLTVLSLFAGFNVMSTTKANADTAGMTYMDTQVKGLAYVQNGNSVILVFRLTESDYDDCGEVKGEFSEPTKYAYISSLSYFKDFGSLNSAGAEFNQPFAYWNGGIGDSMIGTVGANAVAHRTSLNKVEYGLLIYFPAGTTFPCLTYFKNDCTGTPTAYKTTEDVAFCFNGEKFEKMDYNIAMTRVNAVESIKNVDISMYFEAEKKEVADLVQKATKQLDTCMSLLDIQNAVEEFNQQLSKIKTVEDYAQLNSKKAQAKQEISTFFNGMSESAYGENEWKTLMQIKAESGMLIDEAADMAAVDKVVAGIQYKAGEVLTEEEKPAFAQFVAAAVKNVQDAFVATLYREAEATQGAALVEEGKKALEKATTYDEAEALELSYLAKIDALKTAAEWEAEEEANQDKDEPQPEQPQPETEQPSKEEEPKKMFGCGSSVISTSMVIGLAVMAALIVIMKNKKRMDI